MLPFGAGEDPMARKLRLSLNIAAIICAMLCLADGVLWAQTRRIDFILRVSIGLCLAIHVQCERRKEPMKQIRGFDVVPTTRSTLY